jgi:hypothetical protein
MTLKQLLNENEEWKLFLDDIRNPKESGYIIARSVEEAKKLIKEKGFPSHMSLDHDLGEDKKGKLLPTGHDFVKWITKEYQDKELPKFTFNIHSANPVGVDNMKSLLNNFIKFKKSN